jgi:hypothetical protein
MGKIRQNWPVLLALFVFFQPTSSALADRVALVVGNSAYQNVSPLDNPKNDAKLIADTLRDLGFTLIGGGAQLDLDKASFDSVVQKFGTQLRRADVGLFFYAGHGVQVRGSNYLVPIGANPTRETDVDFQMVDVNLVLRQMEGSGTKLNLVILDACRNNPFGGRGLRGTGGGLAQMQAPEGTLISYATQPGNVAQDGADGNSPYSKALAETMRRGGLDIFGTFNTVGLAVKRSTGGSQQPWLSSSPIEGSFYFSDAPAAPATTVVPAPNSTAMAAPSGSVVKPTDPLPPVATSSSSNPAAPQVEKRPPDQAPQVIAALPKSAPTAKDPRASLTTQECSAKYQAARFAGTLNGQRWNDFRKAECGRPRVVFPSTIAPQYSGENPGSARMHTCVDQYNANKAGDANGGMKWIEEGGGYYTECNKKLKGA